MSAQQKIVIEDRWYQDECVSALIDDILSNDDIHPVAAVPTGAGKSVILTKLIDKYLTSCPTKDVLVLSHVAEILEQNYNKLVGYLDGDDFVGLYSAGLKVRDIKKVTVAGIQSIYRRWDEFKNVGLVIIDEAHLINSESDGMYRKFLENIDATYCGVTATHFRTGQGYIHKDYSHIKGRKISTLFNKLSYDLTSYENYNRLVDEGYLVPLIPAPVGFEMSVEGIGKAGGEYKSDELSARYDKVEITKIICDQIIKYAGDKYKKWLLFAIDIDHAINIATYLNSQGIPSKAVFSGSSTLKSTAINEFKNCKIKALINVNMLTTGLDIPEIDLIGFLRSSNSPIYHIQTNGRGTRPAPWINKTHCLVLDFAGNTTRHGPINDVQIAEPGEKKKGSLVSMVKRCGNCGTSNSLRATNCIACGEEFIIDHKLTTEAFTGEMQRSEKKREEEEKELLRKWVKVDDISYSVHQKQGAPNSLRVMYKSGFNSYSEWVLIHHSGWARNKALKWIRQRWDAPAPFPDSLDQIMKNLNKLKKPTQIYVDLSGKFAEIKSFKFEQKEVINVQPNKIPEKQLSNFDDDIPF